MNFANFGDFCEGVAHNIKGPTTIAMAHADRTIGVSSLGKRSGYRSLGLMNFSYGTWRTAAVMAKAGSFAQVPSLLRLSLEGIWYAHLLRKDDGWLGKWNRMSESNTARSKIRNGALKAGKDCMKKCDPALNRRMDELYDELIAIGGHPNLDAIEFVLNKLQAPDFMKNYGDFPLVVLQDFE